MVLTNETVYLKNTMHSIAHKIPYIRQEITYQSGTVVSYEVHRTSTVEENFETLSRKPL